MLRLETETMDSAARFEDRLQETLSDEDLFSPYMPRARFVEELNRFRRAFEGAVVIMREDTKLYFRLTAKPPA